MTINPVQLQSEANAPAAQSSNGFSKFYGQISKHVFDPVKYGAAISKKLQVVVKAGAMEQGEFSADMREFVQEALVLVTLSSVAVGHKGLNPKDDLLVLEQLECMVITAGKFIPLIEKLYNAEEGVQPPPITPPIVSSVIPATEVEVKDNVVTIPAPDQDIIRKEEAAKQSATESDVSTGSTPSSNILDAVKKWQPPTKS